MPHRRPRDYVRSRVVSHTFNLKWRPTNRDEFLRELDAAGVRDVEPSSVRGAPRTSDGTTSRTRAGKHWIALAGGVLVPWEVVYP